MRRYRALGTSAWCTAGCSEVPEGLWRGLPHLYGARRTRLRASWTALAAVQAGQGSAQKSCDSYGSIGLYRNKQCLHLFYFSSVLFLLALKGQNFLHSLLTGEMVKGTLLSPVSRLYFWLSPWAEAGKFWFLLPGISSKDNVFIVPNTEAGRVWKPGVCSPPSSSHSSLQLRCRWWLCLPLTYSIA